MANPEIVWAFLPNGIKDGKLKFSAAVSIRLPESAKPHLALFPEVLDWARTVQALAFDVQFEKGSRVEAIRTSPNPDPDLWQAIFQPDSPIIPFKFIDMSQRPVFAFPVKHVQSFLAQQYINVAAESPEEPPAMERVFRNESLAQLRLKPVTHPRFTGAVQHPMDEQALSQSIRSALARQKIKAVTVSEKPSPAQDFYLLRHYHKPLNKAFINPKTKKPVIPHIPIKPPELDFHQAVSSLTSFPALMRLLGLAIDFEIPIPTGRMPANFSVRIIPHGRTEDKTPWTRCRMNASKEIFEAAPRSTKPEIVDGFLDLSDTDKFDIIQIDVDGAALKTADLADKAEDRTTADLPALRSSGLSVIRTGNAVVLAQALKTAVELHQSISGRRETTFYAEDIVQGYRVDVWDENSKRWYSLCKRIGTYNFLRNHRTETLEDEGFVSEAVTESSDGSSEDLFTHETLFGWDGWSLVAPRPGRTIDKDDKAADIQSQAATAFRLETKFKPVSGSLPRLRFGGRYRLRARAVDLAGNSIGLESTDGSKAIPAPPKEPTSYSRFDPIAPPVIVPRTEPGRGETGDSIVIRSFNDTIAKDKIVTSEIAERHVVPSKTSELGAEVHGMLDAAGGGLRKDVYAMIAAKDPGKLKEVEPADDLILPYFPDPWAKGVIVRGLPGLPADKPMRIEFKGDWPERKPFRIRVVEGDKPSAWDEASRVLTLWLKKSDVVTLRLSCWFPETMLPHIGLYRWLEKPEIAIPSKILQAPQATGPLLVVPPGVQMRAASKIKAIPEIEHEAKSGATIQAQKVKTAQMKATQDNLKTIQNLGPIFQLPRINLTQIKNLALNASHWMMTPYRTVVITHAVQQPLGKPGKKKFTVIRKLGDTHAAFDAEFEIHGSSSQKFDLEAVWKEPIDNVSEKTWKTLDGSAHVLEQLLERGMTSFKMNDATIYRHEFGDTKYRHVDYMLTETTRFREQMPEAVSSDSKQLVRRSDPISIDVPNTAPPAMPRVLYVVPTFGWERKRESGKFTSLRKGGGLRVYLERPWFSSGDGELLAVILTSIPWVPTERVSTDSPAAASQNTMQAQMRTKPIQLVKPMVNAQWKGSLKLPTVPDALRPYVTLWGMDPIWRAGEISTPQYPAPGDFPLAEEMLGGLTIPELPEFPENAKPSDHPASQTFTAIGHKVAYDEERALWYCDIEIDPHDAYFPFVRLALARFQPCSVASAHLSKVVTADFIQLAPDRTISVTFKKDKISEMNIAVSGASYVQAAESGPGTIEVALESHNATLPEEMGWSEVPDTTVTLKAQRMSGAEMGNFIWIGKLKIPKGIQLKNYRVIVREYETFLADDTEGPKLTVSSLNPKTKKARRLVFAETFSLFDL
jgi:hypothetical protein